MLEFNNNHIFTGYLKQLLKDFNLPKYKVYTKEQQEYFDKFGKELNVIESVPVLLENVHHKALDVRDYDENLRYVPYIKDDQIQIYTRIDGQPLWINRNNKAYFYDKKDKNNTKQFIIKNNIYDSYTHRYLGDYLRFQRDYNDIDLMPLYNCFTDECINQLYIQVENAQTYYKKVQKVDDFINNKSYKIVIPFGENVYIPNTKTFGLEVTDVSITTANNGVSLSNTLTFPINFLENATPIAKRSKVTLQYTGGDEEFYLQEDGKEAITIRTVANGQTLYIICTFILKEMSEDDRDTAFEILKPYLYCLTQQPAIFDTTDTNYKIYSVPVKLFNNYTIAISCNSPVEFCCGIYSKYQDTRIKFKDLSNFTYFRAGALSFNQPILYTKLNELPDNALFLNELYTNEDDLRLFIKLPRNNKSTITILEGNYLNWNDYIKQDQNLIKNHAVYNFTSGRNKTTKPITALQLLQADTGKSYPFADRLVEYLSGNVISQLDSIGDNVVRIQKILESPTNNAKEVIKTEIPGLWNDQIRAALYKFATTNQKFINANYTDILGYCDKDIEANCGARLKQVDYSMKDTTISNIDIYTEIYNNIYNEE